KGELREVLDALTARGETRRVVGWRDILDTPEATEAEWQQQKTMEVLECHYDEIWIYGDPAVFDMRERYRLPQRISDRVRYPGYLAPRVPGMERAQVRAALHVGEAPLAVVTIGGGEGGERVLEAWFDAARRGLLPADLRTVVVTGPFMPERAQRRFTSHATAL